MAVVEDAAKLGCPIPRRLDWSQPNPALLFHTASLPEASLRRSRERVSPPAAPSHPRRLPEPGSQIRKRGQRRERGALLSRPQPTSLPHLFRGRDPKPRPAYSKGDTFIFVGLAQTTGSKAGGDAAPTSAERKRCPATESIRGNGAAGRPALSLPNKKLKFSRTGSVTERAHG